MPVPQVLVAWLVEPRALLDDEVAELVRRTLDHGGRSGIEIGVVFVDDAALAEMHGRWLGDASPTDVMAFDLGEEGGGPAGELYVSVECARRMSGGDAADLRRELALYVVHGTLHLCGYDDESDQDRATMRRAESKLLQELGYPPNPLPFE